MTKYIYSTMTSSVDYPNYAAAGGDMPVANGAITIYGGANVPDDKFVMPDGSVLTRVTDDEFEALQRSSVFRAQRDAGFIIVRDHEVNSEVAASEMEGRDKSAPLVDQDFPEDSKPVANEGDKPKPSGRRA